MNQAASMPERPAKNSDIDPSGLLTEVQLAGIRERQKHQGIIGDLSIELLLLNHIAALTAAGPTGAGAVDDQESPR